MLARRWLIFLVAVVVATAAAFAAAATAFCQDGCREILFGGRKYLCPEVPPGGFALDERCFPCFLPSLPSPPPFTPISTWEIPTRDLSTLTPTPPLTLTLTPTPPLTLTLTPTPPLTLTLTPTPPTPTPTPIPCQIFSLKYRGGDILPGQIVYGSRPPDDKPLNAEIRSDFSGSVMYDIDFSWTGTWGDYADWVGAWARTGALPSDCSASWQIDNGEILPIPPQGEYLINSWACSRCFESWSATLRIYLSCSSRRTLYPRLEIEAPTLGDSLYSYSARVVCGGPPPPTPTPTPTLTPTPTPTLALTSTPTPTPTPAVVDCCSSPPSRCVPPSCRDGGCRWIIPSFESLGFPGIELCIEYHWLPVLDAARAFLPYISSLIVLLLIWDLVSMAFRR